MFRQRASAPIQGYRTRDFAFRAFGNEAFERYRAMLDLAARHTYMAAKSYDYETGLLNPAGNIAAAGFYEKVIKARSLAQSSWDSRSLPARASVTSACPGYWRLCRAAGRW